ncbi:DNA-directed RNA polymerase subunit delta [Rossellomorea marisflavi]
MRTLSLKQLSKEELRQTAFIELAHAVLKERKQALGFKEILDEVTSLTGASKEEVKSRLAQFYTDLNIDGQFLALGDNRWGLREWYPVDQIEEETVPTMKSSAKKKKAKKTDEDDLDLDEFDDLEDEDLDFEDLDDTEEDDLTDGDDLDEEDADDVEDLDEEEEDLDIDEFDEEDEEEDSEEDEEEESK